MHTNSIQLERLKTFFHSFFPRTVRSWNDLPAEIAEAKSPSHFNSKLSELF